MSDWFDRVTGSNEYERQSWRDSYNGGKAAGDIFGNTNARLDSEREAFQGATWSGSSSEYSALEVAQMRGYQPDRPATAVGGVVQGRGAAGDAAPRMSSSQAAVSSALMAHGGGGGALGNTLARKPMSLTLGGFDFQANPFYSNAEDGETRHGEIAGEIVGLAALGADLGHNAARMYFGENYRDYSPGQRLAIIGDRTAKGIADKANSSANTALGALFSGVDAAQSWAATNRAKEIEAERNAADIESAWALRDELQRREADKIGDNYRPSDMWNRADRAIHDFVGGGAYVGGSF